MLNALMIGIFVYRLICCSPGIHLKQIDRVSYGVFWLVSTVNDWPTRFGLTDWFLSFSVKNNK